MWVCSNRCNHSTDGHVAPWEVLPQSYSGIQINMYQKKKGKNWNEFKPPHFDRANALASWPKVQAGLCTAVESRGTWLWHHYQLPRNKTFKQHLKLATEAKRYNMEINIRQFYFLRCCYWGWSIMPRFGEEPSPAWVVPRDAGFDIKIPSLLPSQEKILCEMVYFYKETECDFMDRL